MYKIYKSVYCNIWRLIYCLIVWCIWGAEIWIVLNSLQKCRLVLIYGNIPVVLADDENVCPDGSSLGAIETCVNFTDNWIRHGATQCYGGTMRYPCSCVEGYTPYATKFYLWSLGWLECLFSFWVLSRDLWCIFFFGVKERVLLLSMLWRGGWH